MSPTDAEVRRVLHRVAGDVQPDVDQALGRVRQRARRAARRDRLVRLTGAVAAVVLVVVALTLAGTHRAAKPRPVGPPPRPANQVFRVVRTIEPASVGLHRIFRVAVSPAGYLVVTDSSQRVAEITPAGRVLRSWGRPGTGPGEFRLGSGAVAVGADGRIYVADTFNSRIEEFAADGRYLRSLGGFGSGGAAGRFIQPTEVAVDAAGDVYVNDDQQMTLTKLAPDGRQRWRLGRRTTSDLDRVGHWHFTGFDGRGDLVAANDDAGKVLWIAPNGAKVKVFGSGTSSFRSGGASHPVGEFPHGACGATEGPGGLLFVGSCQDDGAPHHGIEVFDQGLHLIAHLAGTPYDHPPVFLPDGTALLVTDRGALVEARLTVH